MVPSFKTATRIDRHHLRMARSGLGLSIRELAELSGMNKATIVRLEAGTSVRSSTLAAVRQVLESKGVEFLSCDKKGRVAVSIKRD